MTDIMAMTAKDPSQLLIQKKRLLQIEATPVKLELFRQRRGYRHTAKPVELGNKLSFIILCVDLTDKEPLRDPLSYLDFYLSNIEKYTPNNCEVFLVGTKADENGEYYSPSLAELARQNNIVYCGNTSAKENINIDNVFFSIANATLQRTHGERTKGQPLPVQLSYPDCCAKPIVFKPKEKTSFFGSIFSKKPQAVQCVLVGEEESALLNIYQTISRLHSRKDERASRFNKHITQVKSQGKLLKSVDISCALSQANTEIPADRAAIIVIDKDLGGNEISQQLLESLSRVKPIEDGENKGSYNISFLVTGVRNPKLPDHVQEMLSDTQFATFKDISNLTSSLMNARDCLLNEGCGIKPLSKAKHAELLEKLEKKSHTSTP